MSEIERDFQRGWAEIDDEIASQTRNEPVAKVYRRYSQGCEFSAQTDDLVIHPIKGICDSGLKLGDELYTAPVACQKCAEAALRDNTANLVRKIEQFDRAITRIGRHVGADCAGVDTEDEHGPGGHTAVAIIEKFDALQAKVTELEAMNAKLAKDVTFISQDSFDQLAEFSTMRRKVAEQSAEIERLKTVPMKYRRMAFNAQLQDENKQQAERIAELEKMHAAQIEEWGKAYDIAMLHQTKVSEQAALIKKCEKVLRKPTHEMQAIEIFAILDEALAAIAAHRGEA